MQHGIAAFAFKCFVRKRCGRLCITIGTTITFQDLYIDFLYGSHANLHSDGEGRELVERIGKVVSLISFP